MKKTLFTILLLASALVMTGCTRKIALFNGQNLDGWKPFVQDNGDPTQVWSVQNGVIHCQGKPAGYLRTADTYSDYILTLEWRWPEKPTNSGVLLHAIGPDKLWPQSIEAQLKHLDAGDFVTIQSGTHITVNGTVYQPDKEFWKVVPKQLASSENPPGQWNQYKIVSKGDTIDLYVNGTHQNSAVNVHPSAGNICIQSEGSPIEFRNIYLTPLK